MRKGFTRQPQPDEPATQSQEGHHPRAGSSASKDEHRFLLMKIARPWRSKRDVGCLTAIAVKTPIISTASGGCGRSMGGFAL